MKLNSSHIEFVFDCIYNNKNTFTEWYNGKESDIPREYRVMSFPQPHRPDPSKVEMDAAAPGQKTVQTIEQPQEPRPVIPIVLTSEKPAEKLKEITDRLEQGITELFDSERYREYLRVMSKFHNYSFNNTLLIAMQKPDASLVAGFSAWKNNFGRNVIKGQKGIKIIAPSPYKVKQEMKKIDPHTQQPIIGKDGKPVTEEKEITIPAYTVVSVFDVSQTEGRELPDIAVNELTGDVERYRDFFAALEKTSPVPIGFEQIPGSSHGYYHLEDKRIAIDEGMSEIQTLKTAIHEIAHAKLHDIDLNAPENEQQPRIDRRTREVEAESVAYTVCQHYGLDTSDYSFGYVAGWSSGRELSELKSSLETIRSAAAEIINSIDETLAELSKAQDKEQTAGQEQPDKEENAAPEQPKQEASAQEKAAFIPETVYRVRRNPYSDRKENAYLLQAYVTQENGRAKMGAVLFTGTPQKCRELMGQLKSGELTEGQVKELYAKAQETAKTAEQDKGTFSISKIFLRKAILGICVMLLLCMANYITFTAARSILSTFQGYQETKYVNQEGVYIANLDPDSHIDMGIVGENGIQAVYDYLNSNFKYAFYTDGFIISVPNSEDMEISLCYINEQYYR